MHQNAVPHPQHPPRSTRDRQHQKEQLGDTVCDQRDNQQEGHNQDRIQRTLGNLTDDPDEAGNACHQKDGRLDA